MTPDNSHKNDESQRVIRVYSALVAAICLQFLPLMATQLLGGLLLLGSFIALYVIRFRSEEKSLAHNHMTYLIRSLWLFGFLMLAGTVFAGVYLATVSDPYPFSTIFEDGHVTIAEAAQIAQIILNLSLLDQIIILGSSAGLPILYMGYRLAAGLSRAVKGYRVPNPKSLL